MACAGFQNLMVWQAERMAVAIREHKYYLSEMAHRDVGSPAAELDFLNGPCGECAADWRTQFCGSVCDFRGECELGAAMVSRDSVAIGIRGKGEGISEGCSAGEINHEVHETHEDGFKELMAEETESYGCVSCGRPVSINGSECFDCLR